MTEKNKKLPPKKWIGKIFWVLLKHSLLAGFAFLLAGIFIVFSMDKIIMPLALKSGIEIKAPDFTGFTIEDAKKIYKGMNFELIIDSEEFNMEFPINTISFQYPSPGTKIKPGRRIRVKVSLGTRPLSMPDVVGKSRRDAELIIKPYGLKIVKQEWIHSNDFVRGIVASQYPEGGQEIPENTEVILYISDGLPETNVIMPNLIDLSFSAAMDTLKTYGFDILKVNIQKEEAPELLPETVIDQHPDPGTAINTSTVVDIVISTSQ